MPKGREWLFENFWSLRDHFQILFLMLILPVPIPDEEKKLAEVFVLTLLCGASEGLMEALMAFIKLFEYEGLKDLHKTFWGATKKCENKNLS